MVGFEKIEAEVAAAAAGQEKLATSATPPAAIYPSIHVAIDIPREQTVPSVPGTASVGTETTETNTGISGNPVCKSGSVAGFSVKLLDDTDRRQKFRVKPLGRCLNEWFILTDFTVNGTTLKARDLDQDDYKGRQIISFVDAKKELFRAYFVPYSEYGVRRMHVSVKTEGVIQKPIGRIGWNSKGVGNGARIVDYGNLRQLFTRHAKGNVIEIYEKDGAKIKVVGKLTSTGIDEANKTGDSRVLFLDTENMTWETKVLILNVLIMKIITNTEESVIEERKKIMDVILLLGLVVVIMCLCYFF